MKTLWPLALVLTMGCGGDSKDDDPGTTDETGTEDSDTDTTNTVTTVPTPTGDPATVPLNGECALDEKWGEFVVANFDFYAIVDGSVSNGVVPVTILENVGEDANCKLLKRNNPFCEPACEASETCDFDGSCIPFPAGQELGTVTVGGLLKPVIMTSVVPGYSYFDTDLPFPVFESGTLIEMRTGGGNYDAVELHGIGVETLTLVEADWILFGDTDLEFNWTAPTLPDVRSQIHVQLNIDQHGLTPIQLFCEFEDDGNAALPRELITSLIDFGVTGFPFATVTRRTVDSTTIGDGCMEFVVKSSAQPNIRVDGFIPCVGDQDCPDGQTCNQAIQICE